MIVTRSYFEGFLYVANVNNNEPNIELLGNRSELQLFIDEYERDCLIKCLGYPLFKEFSSNFEDNSLKNDAPQKIKDILNGTEYAKDGVLYSYRGLAYNNGTTFFSPLADYIYFYFLESEMSRLMGIGLVSEKGKNVTNADPTPRAVRAWSRFRRNIVESGTEEVALFTFLEDNKEVYPNWKPS